MTKYKIESEFSVDTSGEKHTWWCAYEKRYFLGCEYWAKWERTFARTKEECEEKLNDILSVINKLEIERTNYKKEQYFFEL